MNFPNTIMTAETSPYAPGCDSQRDVTSMLTMMSGCDITVEEVTSSLIGLTAAPIWLMGHFLIFSVRMESSKGGQLPTWVTRSLLPHCVADVISCAGAVLTYQLFPQVVFAVLVLCVHAGVAMFLTVHHYFCSIRQYDLHRESLVSAGCTVSLCRCCPLHFCPRLSLLLTLTLLAADVTAIPDNDVEIDGGGHIPSDGLAGSWREITGETLGVIACVGHWLVSLYETSHLHKGERKREKMEGREVVGVVLMMVSNGQYLLTVLWRPRLTWLTSLPWTVCRTGLLGINVAMLVQLWRRTRRRGDNLSSANGEADESLLSTSETGSDAASHSYVLWDTRWQTTGRENSKEASVYQFQPSLSTNPIMPFVDQGRSAGGFRRSAVYDLLPSTDSSCSGTADPDTEVELENHHLLYHTPTSHLAHVPLAQLSPLPQETRHDRVWRWVERSSPDDHSHVMDLVMEHAQYRQHSGSFSHQPPAPSGASSRKNSSIF